MAHAMRYFAIGLGLIGFALTCLGVRLAIDGAIGLIVVPDVIGESAGDVMGRSLFLSEIYARLTLAAVLGVGGVVTVALAALIHNGADGGNG